jgi:acetyl esterase/lipase
MPSWQSHILKQVFRLRRFLNAPPPVLDIQRERAQTEALASYFRTSKQLARTPVDACSVPAEWICAPAPFPDRIILYLHGGAYNSGSIASHRSLVANIATAAQARVLIIEYRLAPESPFPAAVEDTVAAYRWLMASAAAPEKIVVAGDSCGGGLALALVISLRETGEPVPGAIVCLSPWTDLTCTGESWATNRSRELLIDPGSLKQAAKLYLGDSDPQTPLASPLYADLTGLPPLLVQVGSDELLLSDAASLAERAEAAGVDVTLEVWEGMPHEWHFAARILPEARQAIDRIGVFVDQYCG